MDITKEKDSQILRTDQWLPVRFERSERARKITLALKDGIRDPCDETIHYLYCSSSHTNLNVIKLNRTCTQSAYKTSEI